MEHEIELVAAQQREPVDVRLHEIGIIEGGTSRVDSFDTGDEIEQCGFIEDGFADNRDVLACLESQIEGGKHDACGEPFRLCA